MRRWRNWVITMTMMLAGTGCFPAGDAPGGVGSNGTPGGSAVAQPAAPGQGGETTEHDFPPAWWIRYDGADGSSFTPVDPVTLAERHGISLKLSGNYNYAASPDGNQLAVVEWPQNAANGHTAKVRVVDLATRQVRTAPFRIPLNFEDDRVEHVWFAPDGRWLYWIKPRQDPAFTVEEGVYLLARGDLASGQVSVLAKFPASFQPEAYRLLEEGKRLAVYGTVSQGFTPDVTLKPPRVLLIDLAAGRITANVELEGLVAGTRQVSPQEPVFTFYRPGLGWDVQRNRLFVVHPEEERITVVDLNQERVQQAAEIRRLQSWRERLFSWLMPTAHAKLMEGTERQVVVSPDGEHLYLTGMRHEVDRTSETSPVWRQTPLGVSVIATDGFREVKRFDLPVNHLALSPDGTSLLLEQQQHGGDQKGSASKSGIYMVDASSGDIRYQQHAQDGCYFRILGFTPDGRWALVGKQESAGEKSRSWVLDVSSGQVAAEREWSGGYLWFGPAAGY